MDTQVISLLQEIRSALWLLVAILGLFIFVKIIRGCAVLLKTIKIRFDERFKIAARCLFDSGQFKSLLSYCDQQEKKYPHDGYPFWFRAQVYYQQEEYDKALENFNKVIDIFPTWEKEWVGPYIEKINAKNKLSRVNNT